MLFVAGLHEETQDEDIRDVFRDFGKVSNLHLNLDRRSGYAKGYAMVEYEEQTNAKAAREALNGAHICGKAIHVDWAFVMHETLTPESWEKKSK